MSRSRGINLPPPRSFPSCQPAPAAVRPNRRRRCRASSALVLAALLAVFLVGTPASAGPRPSDPEVRQPAARATERSAARVAPAVVDSDVYVYAVTPKSRLYFVVAGHLKLTLKSGSTTKYGGSFVDYVGNKSYKASADAGDAAAPVLKLEGKNGKFSFQLDQYFGSSLLQRQSR